MRPEPATASVARWYHVAGVTLRLGADHPVVADRLFALMDYFGFDQLAAATPTAGVSLDLVAGTEAVPARDHEAVVVEPMGVNVSSGAGGMLVDDGESWVRVDYDRCRAAGVVRLLQDGPARFNLNLVTYTLLTLLRFRGLFPVHAAGLALDGAGSLLVGDSGSGKSTLAFNLVRAGWGILSDDSLLLSLGPEGVRAAPLRRDLFLIPGGNESPEGLWETCRLAEPEKKRLRVRAAYPERCLASCLPRVLIFPRVCPEETSRVEPCAKTEALNLLAHQSLVADMERLMATGHLGLLRDLVNQCHTYHLVAGHDLVDDPGRCANLVRPLLVAPSPQASPSSDGCHHNLGG